MLFHATELPGVWLLESERKEDERGFFARTWCRQEFAARGLDTDLAQCSASFNKKTGTLRGMHYQSAPREESKVVRCTSGAIYDVVIDLRPNSPTFKKWTAAELTASNGLSLYVPKGCAHGLQTLVDDTDVLYLISEFFDPALSQGVRWDDPAFDVKWPLPVSCISEKDRTYPDFRV